VSGRVVAVICGILGIVSLLQAFGVSSELDGESTAFHVGVGIIGVVLLLVALYNLERD
jgi:hypothetical protein